MAKKWPIPIWRVTTRPTEQTEGYVKVLLRTTDKVKAKAFYEKKKPARGKTVALLRGIMPIAVKATPAKPKRRGER